MQLTWAIKHEIERTARLVWDGNSALHGRYPSREVFEQDAVSFGQELATAHTLNMGRADIAELAKRGPEDFRFVAADLLQAQVNAANAAVAAAR